MGANVSIVDSQGLGTINNDDSAAVTIDDASGNEDDGPITVTARLDNAVQGGFSVDLSTADGSATIADGDYTAVNSTLTFTGAEGETQTITLTPTVDTVIEPDESLSINQSNLSGTSLDVDISGSAAVTINNDDIGELSISGINLSLIHI